jgi:hypothetical protein
VVILATAGQRSEAPMLGALMEAGAVRRPRGQPRIRPAMVLAMVTIAAIVLLWLE